MRIIQYSVSRVDSFVKCPYKWYLHYIKGLETLDECDPTDPLKLGTCVHESIEMDVDTAIQNYMMKYPIIDDRHVNEEIKIRNLVRKVDLPRGGQFEVELIDDDFKGFIDYLVPVGDEYDLYDFKYSNNIENYKKSPQLHVYKYYAEKLHGIKIRKLFYLMIPKTQIRQKKTEDLYQFRKRLMSTLEDMRPEIVEIEYDPNKVIEFFINGKHMIEAKNYETRPSKLCNWCQYQKYCESDGQDDLNIIYK